MANKRKIKAASAKNSAKAEKVLRRSKSNRMLFGVMGGLAEYFEVDPMHVRILWGIVIVASGLAAGAIAYALVPTVLTLLAVAYIVAYLLMSEPPEK